MRSTWCSIPRRQGGLAREQALGPPVARRRVDDQRGRAPPSHPSCGSPAGARKPPRPRVLLYPGAPCRVSPASLRRDRRKGRGLAGRGGGGGEGPSTATAADRPRARTALGAGPGECRRVPGPAPRPGGRVPRPALSARPGRTYLAVVQHELRALHDHARRGARAQDRGLLRLAGPRRLLRRPHLPPHRPRLRRSRAATRPATGTGGPGYTVVEAPPAGRSTRAAWWPWPRPRPRSRAPRAASSTSSPAPTRSCRPTTRCSAG